MKKEEYKYSEKREYILDALDNYLYNLKGMHDHYKELCEKREKEVNHLESKIHDLNDQVESLQDRVAEFMGLK